MGLEAFFLQKRRVFAFTMVSPGEPCGFVMTSVDYRNRVFPGTTQFLASIAWRAGGRVATSLRWAKVLRVWMLGLALLLVAHQSQAASWPDPERLRASIDAFGAADLADPPPEGAVVGVGSSSMWICQTGSRFSTDFAPLTVINRGFGGSVMNDVHHFLAETVLRYRPRAVLIYEGDNDVSLGIPVEKIMASLQAIVEQIHHQDAWVRIYLMSVKPSPARWALWPAMQELNRAYQGYAATDQRIVYLDLGTAMLTAAGEPDSDIFLSDGLHMNAKGYALWRRSVADPVVTPEQSFEPTP